MLGQGSQSESENGMWHHAQTSRRKKMIGIYFFLFVDVWLNEFDLVPRYHCITLPWKFFSPLLYSCILNQKIMGAICPPRQIHYHPTSEKNVHILRKISLPWRTHYQKLLVPFQPLQHVIRLLESVLYQNPTLWLVSSQEVCIIFMLQMMVNFQTCINCLLIKKENHWY